MKTQKTNNYGRVMIIFVGHDLYIMHGISLSPLVFFFSCTYRVKGSETDTEQIPPTITYIYSSIMIANFYAMAKYRCANKHGGAIRILYKKGV